jgi:photosynthetic reaction center H subunit
MPKGAITQYVDVAQVVLYFFWAFFAYLIYYLRREDKREGYPLAYERQETRPYLNFPSIPKPKTFLLPHGGSVEAPRPEPPQPELNAVPVAAWPGAPLEPIGDAMRDGVGPGSWVLRADTPDLTLDGLPKIVPLRIASGEKLVTHATQGTEASPPPTSGRYHHFTLSPRDPDPRGMQVIGADHGVAGVVTDVWIDVSEVMIRYLEVQVAGTSTTVLLPMPFALIKKRYRDDVVHVRSILASQFAGVPKLANPEQVTFREEDRICAYYGGGTLYATPLRRESVL